MDLFETGLRRVYSGLGVSVTDPETTEEIETTDTSKEVGSSGTPSLVSGVSSKNILHHPDAHPVALDLLLIKKYGLDWLEWDAESAEIIIPRDLNSPISEVNAHKINAMRALHLVDSFWEKWEVFIWTTMAFNGVLPNFTILQVPTVAQCMVAVDTANRVRMDVSWSEEVKNLLASVHLYDGILCPQPPLEFVHVDTSELIVHRKDIEKEWPEVRSSKKAPTEDTHITAQLRRMLEAEEYLEHSRSLLHQQLQVIQSV